MKIQFGSSNHAFQEIAVPRPLSVWEDRVVERLLVHGRSADVLAAQAARAVVDLACSHCPTVHFRVDPEIAALTERGFGVISTAYPVAGIASDIDGMEMHILLLIEDGYLKSLDATRVDGAHVRRVPHAGDLKTVRIPSQIVY